MTTVAQNLGYLPDEKLLIIHSDDLGESRSQNSAAFLCFEFGLVKSASVMMPCFYVDEVIDYYKKNPDIDLGIHLTLNSEWDDFRWKPLSDPHKIKGLTDSDGCFYKTSQETINSASDLEVETELDAQIKKALNSGLKPTHLDYHMGTITYKYEWIQILLKLSQKYKIPPLISRWSEEFEKTEIKPRGLPTDIIKKLLLELEKKSMSKVDLLTTIVGGTTIDERKKFYDNYLKNIKPGITQLVIHPGIDNEELRSCMPKGQNGPIRREADYRYFTDPKTKQLINDLNIKLISWENLIKQN